MLKILAIILGFAIHPVHVTLMSIEYSAEKEGFEAFIKVYFDDFLLDYQLFAGEVPEFDFNGKNERTIELMESYLNERVQVNNGKVNLGFKISGLTLSDNELKVNLFFDKPGRAKSFHVKNEILTEIYKDQTNLLIFKYDKFEEGVKLTADKAGHVFNVK